MSRIHKNLNKMKIISSEMAKTGGPTRTHTPCRWLGVNFPPVLRSCVVCTHQANTQRNRQRRGPWARVMLWPNTGLPWARALAPGTKQASLSQLGHLLS